MNIHLNNRPILHDLGDGMILCRSMADDAEAFIPVSLIQFGKQ